MTNQEFLRLFEQVTESDLFSIQIITKLSDVGGWDSLAVIGLISRLDSDYNLRLQPDDLPRCATVGDIASLIIR